MFFIIHGTDISSSRNKMQSLIGSGFVERIDCEKIEIQEIKAIFKSQDMFMDKRTVLLENITKLSKKNLEKLTSLINESKNSNFLTIIIWHNDTISQSILKNLKEGKILLFELPKYYFSFLDSLSPKNKSFLLRLKSNISDTISDELLFYSIIKRVRLLLLIKSGIDTFDVKQLKTWQLLRLKKQAVAWNEADLALLYRKLFDLEVRLKTSNLPLTLSDHIDILLASKT